MFIFSRYKMIMSQEKGTDCVVVVGDELYLSLDNDEDAKPYTVKDVNKSNITIMDNDEEHCIDLSTFIKLYEERYNTSIKSTHFVNEYLLSEHGEIYPIGYSFKLSAPLLRFRGRVRLINIDLTLSRVDITFKEYNIYGNEFTITEPLDIKELPKPGIDIINLPQYYISW